MQSRFIAESSDDTSRAHHQNAVCRLNAEGRGILDAPLEQYVLRAVWEVGPYDLTLCDTQCKSDLTRLHFRHSRKLLFRCVQPQRAALIRAAFNLSSQATL